jgi:hypothetical protein
LFLLAVTACRASDAPQPTAFYELSLARLHWYPATAGRPRAQHVVVGERWKSNDQELFVSWVDFYDYGKASFRKFDERRIRLPVAECRSGASITIPLISYWDIDGEWMVGDPSELVIPCGEIASWAEDGDEHVSPRFRISREGSGPEGEVEIEVLVVNPKSKRR